MTDNFKREEFKCKHCSFNIIDERIVNRLQVIRDFINQPIQVLSGCRCPEYNERVGGAKESFHTKGYAVDFTVLRANDTVDEPALLMIDEAFGRRWSGGYHYYIKQRFIHIDIGPRRRW